MKIDIHKIFEESEIYLSDMTCVDIVGDNDNAKQFLDGQVTSDIALLSDKNKVQLSSICNQKGYVVCDFFLIWEEGFKIVLDKNKYPKLISELEIFARFSKVELVESQVNIIGEVSDKKNEWTFLKNKFGNLGIKLSDNLDLNLPQITSERWQVLNLLSNNLLLTENYLGKYRPDEIMYDDMRVSFTKGCFRGQEIIARIKYRSKKKYSINKIASNTKEGLNSENLSLLCDPLKFDNCYFGLARFDSDKTTNEADLIIL